MLYASRRRRLRRGCSSRRRRQIESVSRLESMCLLEFVNIVTFTNLGSQVHTHTSCARSLPPVSRLHFDNAKKNNRFSSGAFRIRRGQTLLLALRLFILFFN